MEMNINRLPAPTWNCLRMNEAVVKDVRLGSGETENITIVCPEDVTCDAVDLTDVFEHTRTGLGEDMVSAVSEICEQASRYTVGKGQKASEPVRMSFSYDGIPSADAFSRVAKEGSEMTVIMDFTAEESSETGRREAVSLTHYHVEKGAHLTLIQVQRLPGDYRFFNDIGGDCEESGTFSLIQLVLGGKDTYMGCFTSLHEKRAALTTDIAYLLKDEETLDMNYVADHTGRKTNCDIFVAGVLRNAAKKLFRGTIDFHRGCAGSVGTEMEEVLLMDGDVRNQTIPLILCDEEDVEGNHGASIGRVDENVLFYLRSRGICDEEIYEMMARAKVDSVLSKIEDEVIVESVRKFLDGDPKESVE